MTTTATTAMTITMTRGEPSIPGTSQAFSSAPAPGVDWLPMPLALRDGTRIAAYSAGRTDPDAPAVVFVHGLGHWTQSAWGRLVPLLAGSHRAIAFDLPGFGASEKPDASYSLAYLTAALRDVVDALSLRTFGLCGHSLGGLIAAAYAADHAERVRALGLIDPAGFTRTPGLFARMLASRAALAFGGPHLPAGVARAAIRAQWRGALYDRTMLDERDVDDAIAVWRDRAAAQAFFRVYASAVSQAFAMRAFHVRLVGFRGPVTIVWGANDRYLSPRGMRTALRVYPQAESLLIDRCGHCPAIERPHTVAQRLLRIGM